MCVSGRLYFGLWYLSRPSVMVLSVLLVACLVGSGCQSAMYTPYSLPTEYVAPPIIRQDALDLSRLTGPAARNDVIQPGDQLSVSVATGIEDSEPWLVRVSSIGALNIPIIGPVAVVGLTFNDAESAIRNAGVERGKFVSPTVSVVLQERRANLVTVLGAVQKPGSYELPAAGSDVLSAIMAADGINEDAGTVIEVWHSPGVPTATPMPGQAAEQFASYGMAQPGSPQSTRLRVDLASTSPSQRSEYRVWDGSVVNVLPRPARTVQVIGLVNASDQFDIPSNQDVRLLDALAMAGDRRLQIADKVKIVRQISDKGEMITIGTSVREAKRNSVANIRLAPGDVVSVEQTPATFTVEMLRSFIRFGFSSAIPGF